MKKDIFLVDADDTILDFQKASANAIQDAFSYFGVQWEDRFATEYKLLNDELWERLERKELTRDRLHAIRFHSPRLWSIDDLWNGNKTSPIPSLVSWHRIRGSYMPA